MRMYFSLTDKVWHKILSARQRATYPRAAVPANSITFDGRLLRRGWVTRVHPLGLSLLNNNLRFPGVYDQATEQCFHPGKANRGLVKIDVQFAVSFCCPTFA
jgi:hypothetical protein